MELSFYQKKMHDEIVEPMLEYRREVGKDSGYGLFQILQCRNILRDYLKRLNRLRNQSEGAVLCEVKRTVLRLNKLNDKTEGCLIETDARESIWELIQTAAIDCGLKLSDEEEDITSEWREW